MIPMLEKRLSSALQAQFALLILGLVTWSGVIHGGTVSHDTSWLMRDNPILSSGSLHWLPTIWTDFSIDVRHVLGAEFLPVRDTDILIDFKLFGDNWALHHAGNLIWYLVGCGLFLSICRRILGPGLISWTAAALFCVHPLHTQNVAWLAGRKDLLGLVFFLAAWRLWLINVSRERSTAPVFLLFIVGVWSKNTTIVLPAVLVLSDLILHEKRPTFRWKHWGLWGAAALPLVALSTQLGKQMRLFGEPHYEGVANGMTLQVQLWFQDLGHLFWPHNLAINYPAPESAPLFSLAIMVSLLAGLAGLAWRFRKTNRVVSLGIGVFFVCSLPTTAFNQLQNLSADRYLLLPSLGIALFMGALLHVMEPRSKRLLQGVLLVSILALSWRSQVESRVWRSDLNLWSSATRAQPRALSNWTGHARALRASGRSEEALELLTSTQDRFGENPLYFQSLGALYLHHNELENAEQHYRKALSINPQLRISGNDLAILLSRTGRLEEALPIAKRMTKAHPGYSKGFNTLGALLLDARELDAAESALLQAESMEFENARAACNLGGVYWLKMQDDPSMRPAAEWWWTQCKRRDPTATVPPGLQLAL